MSRPRTVGLVSPGEMGEAIGGALEATGQRVVWASDGRSERTRARARERGLEDVGTLGALTTASEIVLSVCPPQFALEAARAVCASFGGIYVDANAIAPATAERVAQTVAAAGATYVDGGIIGPPPLAAGSTRLYLSGAAAPEVAEAFAGGPLEARVLGAGGTAASALKMSYAGWTKGSAALLLTMHEAARRLGVGEELAAEWQLSQPGLRERAERAGASRASKGWRWAPEMHEIAATLGAVGLPQGFHQAAADVFAHGEGV